MQNQDDLPATSPAIAGEADDQKNKDKREYCVSVRLNSAEQEWLENARKVAGLTRGAYLRTATIGKLPPVIPAINQAAWVDLSRLAANFNQAQKDINKGRQPGHLQEQLDELQAALTSVRKLLIKDRFKANSGESK